MQPLLAAVDGTVTRVRYENKGTAGSVITVTGADGWRYNYFHVNNDTPGTDDGVAGTEWQISPQVTLGSFVQAGQVIAYMGDSGNAEGSVPHLHFEIRQPDGTPINPYQSLTVAQRHQTCAPEACRHDGVVRCGRGHRHRRHRPLADRRRRQPRRRGLGRSGRGRRVRDRRAAGARAARRRRRGHPIRRRADAVRRRGHAARRRSGTRCSAPVDLPWIVERGQSLWSISERAYGLTDTADIVATVNAVFEHNRDQLSDPSMLNIGMTLRLPAR